jgi:membrane protease subunit HflC
VERAGSEDLLRAQLEPILTSVLRQELGRRTFASLLTPERGNAMVNIRNQLDEQARQYGAHVLDVRIKRADLPQGTPLQAAFTRMQSDRQEEAETIRAGGRRDAQIIRAEAEANAARIYADAFNKDPEFYDFFRAMQSYRASFMGGEGNSSIIMDESNDYLRQFRGGNRCRVHSVFSPWGLNPPRDCSTRRRQGARPRRG